MPHDIVATSHDTLHVRIRGTMRKEDLEALQALAKPLLQPGRRLKVLAVLDGFEGWAKSEDWENTGFLGESGQDAARMAFVGDPRWRDDVFTFVGYGLRSTAMAYFPPEALEQAKAWLNGP